MAGVNYEDLIGVEFLRGGRDIQSGLDCVGLAMEILRRGGLIVPEPGVDYVGDWEGRRGMFVSRWPNCFEKIDIPSRELDVSLLKNKAGQLEHIVTMVRPGRFLDVTERVGVHVRSWRTVWDSIESSYRFKGGAEC